MSKLMYLKPLTTVIGISEEGFICSSVQKTYGNAGNLEKFPDDTRPDAGSGDHVGIQEI